VAASFLGVVGLFVVLAQVRVLPGWVPNTTFALSGVAGLAGGAVAALARVESGSKWLGAWRAVCLLVGLLVGGYAMAVVLFALAGCALDF